jgi:hypothetical protein
LGSSFVMRATRPSPIGFRGAELFGSANGLIE